MAGGLVESADGWQIPMAGLTVTQCRMDFAFTIVIAGEAAELFEVRVEQPFTLTGRGEEHVIDPEGEPAGMAPAMGVLRQHVERAIAFKDGRLELGFSDGVVLRASVSDSYESWNVVGPAGLRLVSLPGGGLAIWSPEADQGPTEPD